MNTLARQLRRVGNGVRKYRAGLSLFGENISPVVPNDLYVAHLSIYLFFARFSTARSVLDLGCGAGYGSLLLADRGARHVVGIDLDRRNVEFAAKRAGARPVKFVQGNAEALAGAAGAQWLKSVGLGEPAGFEVIVSSNVFEHLVDVDAALDGVVQNLAQGGDFLLAVPPIVGPDSLRANEAIRYHRTNLEAAEWHRRLSARFPAVRSFLHQPPEGCAPDFGNPFPSRMKAEDFRFVETDVGAYYNQPSLTAIFACTVSR